jgi:tRNA dimethylallyltransferase
MQLITILGQTSSGKSDLAIELAKLLKSKKIRTCIVGCDSRQIYKGLDIGTGKIQGRWTMDKNLNKKVYKYQSIDHFLIDFVDPTTNYNLQNYITDFYNLMFEIEEYFDYVILVGGTGLYAKAINEKINLGSIKSEFIDEYDRFKNILQSSTIEKLQSLANNLQIDLNNSDYNNKIRLVSNLLKAHCEDNKWLEDTQYYNFEIQYLFAKKIEQKTLIKKITKRLNMRFDFGIIDETKKFICLGEEKFMSLGLEYRQGWLYLNDKISIEKLKENLLIENIQYAKRQLTWLKSQKNIIWIRNLKDILKQIKL